MPIIHGSFILLSIKGLINFISSPAAAPAKAGAQDAAINVAAVQEKAHAVAPEVDCSIRKITTESSSDPSTIVATSLGDLHAPVAAAPAADGTQESLAAQVAEDVITDEASSD